MDRLLALHLRVTAVAVRLFQLHLLWLAWTLRGAVIVGVFPATATVYAVLRRDVLDGDDAVRGWRPLRRSFRDGWRAELGPANRRGYLLLGAWLIVGLSRRAVDLGVLGASGPALAVALAVVTVLLAAMTAHVETLAAHFDDGALRALRRAAVLAVARPGATLVNLLGVGIVVVAYVQVPGLVPVFGVAAPAWLSTQYLWGTGVLARPPAADKTPTRV
jgi:uncharacterized membrane protein YesL